MVVWKLIFALILLLHFEIQMRCRYFAGLKVAQCATVALIKSAAGIESAGRHPLYLTALQSLTMCMFALFTSCSFACNVDYIHVCLCMSIHGDDMSKYIWYHMVMSAYVCTNASTCKSALQVDTHLYTAMCSTVTLQLKYVEMSCSKHSVQVSTHHRSTPHTENSGSGSCFWLLTCVHTICICVYSLYRMDQ